MVRTRLTVIEAHPSRQVPAGLQESPVLLRELFMKSALFAKLALVLGAAFITMSVTACNTTEGAGKDMERAGEGIQDAAK